MLLKRATLEAIRDGSIRLAFRRWKRPTVKAGGTLRTAIGVLAIEAVDRVDPADITAAEAREAGFSDPDAVRAELARREGDAYRIRLAYAGADPRIALREEIPDEAELEQLLVRLRRTAARTEPTLAPGRLLESIERAPATRAADLASELDVDRARFKARVRRLKALGLTESLKSGYRLSPRGVAVLERLRRGD